MNFFWEKKLIIHFVNLEVDPRLWSIYNGVQRNASQLKCDPPKFKSTIFLKSGYVTNFGTKVKLSPLVGGPPSTTSLHEERDESGTMVVVTIIS
jgi:hypothetical protein